MELLLENGAKINSNDASGWSPFQNAIKEKNLEMINFFMENNAELKIRTKHFKYNAIELALKIDAINIVKKLIHFKCNTCQNACRCQYF